MVIGSWKPKSILSSAAEELRLPRSRAWTKRSRVVAPEETQEAAAVQAIDPLGQRESSSIAAVHVTWSAWSRAGVWRITSRIPRSITVQNKLVATPPSTSLTIPAAAGDREMLAGSPGALPLLLPVMRNARSDWGK